MAELREKTRAEIEAEAVRESETENAAEAETAAQAAAEDKGGAGTETAEAVSGNAAPAGKRIRLPRVGSRVKRTVIACLVVSFVYDYFFKGRNPCFACIGAVYGMGSQFQEGFRNGFNRFVGTFIGGLVVIPFYWLYRNQPLGIPQWVYLSIGLFFVIYINLMFGANNAIQPGTVVYFVVMFTQPETNFVGYTLARIVDTGIGVLVSLIITMLHPTQIDREKGIDFLTFEEAIRYSFMTWRHHNEHGSVPELNAEQRAAKRAERKAKYDKKQDIQKKINDNISDYNL